jgi:hypothetical protein
MQSFLVSFRRLLSTQNHRSPFIFLMEKTCERQRTSDSWIAYCRHVSFSIFCTSTYLANGSLMGVDESEVRRWCRPSNKVYLSANSRRSSISVINFNSLLNSPALKFGLAPDTTTWSLSPSPRAPEVCGREYSTRATHVSDSLRPRVASIPDLGRSHTSFWS